MATLGSKEYDNVNSNRYYPVITDNNNDRKNKFRENNNMFSKQYQIPKKSNENIRLMTFNVQSWVDLDNVDRRKEINDLLENIQPDIVCMQEILWGQKGTTKSIDLRDVFTNYKIVSFC